MQYPIIPKFSKPVASRSEFSSILKTGKMEGANLKHMGGRSTLLSSSSSAAFQGLRYCLFRFQKDPFHRLDGLLTSFFLLDRYCNIFLGTLVFFHSVYMQYPVLLVFKKQYGLTPTQSYLLQPVTFHKNRISVACILLCVCNTYNYPRLAFLYFVPHIL